MPLFDDVLLATAAYAEALAKHKIVLTGVVIPEHDALRVKRSAVYDDNSADLGGLPPTIIRKSGASWLAGVRLLKPTESVE